MPERQKEILMICLGNICRSPIAEAVMIDVVKKQNLSDKYRVDSAATAAYHVGKSPDHRALDTMKKHNLEYNNKARVITDDDFKKFDYIFVMDNDNFHDLCRAKPIGGTARIFLLGDFDPEGEKIIRDPYYDSGSEGFEKVYQQSVRCCEAFLKKDLAGERLF